MENKKTKTKLLSNVTNVLLILSVCLCLFVFFQVISRGYVSLAGYSFFRVSTGSMEPELPIGTIILTKDSDINDIEIDDIVSFYSKEQYMMGRIITHRVVDKEEGIDGAIRLTTRGDANSAADVYFVDEENYIGRLVWNSESENVIANIIAFLSGKMGFFTCIAIPAIIVAVIMFNKSMKTMLRETKKLKAELESVEATETTEAENVQATEEDSVDSQITSEEYNDMYERIRAELIKELKTENDREQNE